MSRVIAGVYEINNQIGAGGGGIVYLGRHLRLEKQIVLKADKRRLSTQTEALRREVDMLKSVSHTYIPQVYDFVQEDGVVYTVMDFIDGESLDKLLSRGQIPTQPEVIKWACQLLEALAYLHGRPPHGILHGDIKPANIMLRPNGDMCLIDFNIALALGEDGAVKVGFSRGYASPEHYGADYVKSSRNAAGIADDFSTLVDDEQTVADNIKNEINPAPSLSLGRTADSHNGVMLDVRSDIYSLGATLYHLISGKRPAQKAADVIPLGPEVCSPAVSDIIRKAMSPQPKDRYQTAEEMLTAFLQLYRTDKRAVRHKRHMKISAVMLTLMFLLGGGCSFVGLKQLEQRQEALTLAEYSANALADGDISGAVDMALQAIPSGKSIFEAPVTAEAQKALTDALGVYDLSDGFKPLNSVELSAAPFDIVVSPEGSRFAVMYAYEVAVFDFDSLQKIITLPAEASALADVVFTDENHIIYAGDGKITAYDLSKAETVWTGDMTTQICASGNRDIVAAVNRNDNHAAIYRASDGERIMECSFGEKNMPVAVNDIFADPANYIFSLNEDGSMLAVSFSDGSLIVYNLNNPEECVIVYEESDYVSFEGGFYNQFFAFCAKKSGESVFGLIDMENAAYAGGYTSSNNILLRSDEKGIYLAEERLLVRIDPDSMEERELAYTNGEYITAFAVGGEYTLIAAADNSFSFYDSAAQLMSSESCTENSEFVLLTDKYAVIANRSETALRLLELDGHTSEELLKYDAGYTHDEARLSADGQTAMLFSYQNFRIYDMTGTIVAEAELPDAAYIYDQQFKREDGEAWLEVIWYDGTVRCYSAADGSLMSEVKGEAPSRDLYEEFFTKQYRITSSLHDAPVVYDISSGKEVAVLEQDSYLTYVTQVEEYIITEYVSAEGERYGILLDGRLQKLANLPNLCDILEDTLVFDFESGNLRFCRLYSLQELIALGESY
ncbi:MAG: WD40 repeat domain-containing serine/threonine protein kinase [Lachnospiraceae bacterium]|nr:WD40 repeat domain-containing serine/threonine protein kinase [Lachnospiraceae bacterium]